jgi:putative FmdB family regulatory protein
MPTYEYRCEKCNETFETFQSMKDAPFTTCPEQLCRLEQWGQGKVKRLLGTGAGIIFKGSGFYQTDYRSSSYQEAAKKEAGPSDSGAKEAGAKDKPAKAEPAAPKKTESSGSGGGTTT